MKEKLIGGGMEDKMNEKTDEKILEAFLKESLEKDIINLLSERIGITTRKAMDIFYRSKLSVQIDCGAYGIQYLDDVYLVDDLLANEQELVIS